MEKNIEKNIKDLEIKSIIGLGNPGKQHFHNRHTIGLRIIEELAKKHGGIWECKKDKEVADIVIRHHALLLVKPMMYMNASGRVIPQLQKDGIKPENMLVIHDELEQSFGVLKFKVGGSHRGHNGLKSIIERCGKEFARLRFGIGRPENKDDVPNYVLQNFSQDPSEVTRLIGEAIEMVEGLFI